MEEDFAHEVFVAVGLFVDANMSVKRRVEYAVMHTPWCVTLKPPCAGQSIDSSTQGQSTTAAATDWKDM
jgi:hypothetical protein